MKSTTILYVMGAVAGVVMVMLSKPKTTAMTSSGASTNLNTGIYNPIYNPGGQTNYIGTYTTGVPPTGYSNSILPLGTYDNLPTIH